MFIKEKKEGNKFLNDVIVCPSMAFYSNKKILMVSSGYILKKLEQEMLAIRL